MYVFTRTTCSGTAQSILALLARGILKACSAQPSMNMSLFFKYPAD
jgi:hypothetical protein